MACWTKLMEHLDIQYAGVAYWSSWYTIDNTVTMIQQ